MKEVTGTNELNEEQEAEILDEMWEKQIAGLNRLQNNLTDMIKQAEQIGKRFNTHHKGMRYSINAIEILISDIEELREKHAESRELARSLTNRNRSLY